MSFSAIEFSVEIIKSTLYSGLEESVKLYIKTSYNSTSSIPITTVTATTVTTNNHNNMSSGAQHSTRLTLVKNQTKPNHESQVSFSVPLNPVDGLKYEQLAVPSQFLC